MKFSNLKKMDKLEALKNEVEDIKRVDFNSLSPIQLEIYSNKLDEIVKQGINALLELTQKEEDEKVPIDEGI